jgi:DNA invertase Pin-like site-specific DNA recombinase
MTEPLRVVGYTRVSTEEQAVGGFGLDAQEAKIRGYCGLYDLDLVRIHSDPGASGKDLDRPGVQEVLAELRRRKDGIDGVVVAKLDRLTRSLRDCADLIDQHFGEKRDKRLFSVEESIDTRRAAGRLVLNVIMTVAQWEREVISERTRDALQAKIAKGERCGKVRFGFDLDDDGKTLVENHREQEAIRLMKQWRAQGKSYRELVRLVEELGIETKEGGRIWLPMTIRRILCRPTA